MQQQDRAAACAVRNPSGHIPLVTWDQDRRGKQFGREIAQCEAMRLAEVFASAEYGAGKQYEKTSDGDPAALGHAVFSAT